MIRLLILFLFICGNVYAEATPANTVLLIHADGTDTSQTFTDDSDSAHTVTANGNAQVDTAQKKFGTGSLLCDGTGDYLSIADSTDFAFGGNNYTQEFWVRISAGQADYDSLLGQWGGSNPNRATLIYFMATEKIHWGYNGAELDHLISDSALSTNTWYHVAVERNSSTSTKLFIDGTAQTTVYTTDYTVNDATQDMQLCSQNGASNEFAGWMEEILIVNAAIYGGSNFTPPTTAYTADSARRILMVKRFIKKETGGYDRVTYSQNFAWGDVRLDEDKYWRERI